MGRSYLKRMNLTSASQPTIAGPAEGIGQVNQKGAIMANSTRKTRKSPLSFIKKHKTAISCIAGAAVLGPVAFIAAPVVAAAAGTAGLLGTTATAGTAISSLAGAALTNASLAAIGNGALVAGGAGIAGGTAVITGAGAAAGAATGLGVKSAASAINKKAKK